MVTGPRFEDLTETTGIPVSREGVEMMVTRYHVAAAMAKGRRVLELGCGAGQGLGLIGRTARSIVGGDYSSALLRTGKRHYAARVPLVQLSAESLPFKDQAFDLVVFFEASYYVPDMAAGFREIARVLTPGGQVLFVNANPERPDFIHSPRSTRYHSADDFRAALERLGMAVEVEGAFPVEPPATGLGARFVGTAVRTLRRTLDALGLIPKTLRGRARLKRLVYGKLLDVPPELPSGFSEVEPRVPVPPGPVRSHKVIYVKATKPLT